MKSTKEVTTTKIVDVGYQCDKCGKDMTERISNSKHVFMKGGYFLPSFDYGSQYDMLDTKMDPIHMCDDCWTQFFDSLLHQPKGYKCTD